jgi:hypothetical protein
MLTTDPVYRVDIQRLDTEQRLFHGIHNGLLVPVLQGIILDHARITDAGGRLEWEHLKYAYRDGGYPLPQSAFRFDRNVYPLAS